MQLDQDTKLQNFESGRRPYAARNQENRSDLQHGALVKFLMGTVVVATVMYGPAVSKESGTACPIHRQVISKARGTRMSAARENAPVIPLIARAQ